jgi:hypothetical protein
LFEYARKRCSTKTLGISEERKISRKGAKAQSAAACLQGLPSLRLCAFAPLREKFFFLRGDLVTFQNLRANLSTQTLK